MTTTPLLADRGPSTYLDTLDASADHSQAGVAPMVKDRTTLLVGQTLGSPELGATADMALVVTAAEDFDGTVTLTATPIADPWSPSLLLADLPDTDGPTATFTGTLVAGQTATFDVSAAATAFAAASIDCEGWLIVRTDSGTAGSLYTARVGDDRAPVLIGSFLSEPDAPTGLVPYGNLIVGVAKPVVKADQPASGMVSQQWQINSTAAGFTASSGIASPSFDSGEVASSALQLDLSTTAFAGFPSAGTTRYLTCRYKDATGEWSDWATPVQCGGWSARPEPTITSQSGGVATDPTPVIEWTPDGTQTQYQVACYPFGSTTPLTDSKPQASTATAYQTFPPAPVGTTDGTEPGILCKGTEPIVSVVRQWDDEDRIATPGCPVYGEASQTFQFFGNATVRGVDDVSAQQIGKSPWFTYQITMSQATADATAYVIFTLGATAQTAVHIARKKLSALGTPVESEGSLIYTWICWTAQPWQPSYAAGVKLVDTTGHTSDATYDTLTSLEVSGMWFGDANPDSKTFGVISQHSGVGSHFTREDQWAEIPGLARQFPDVQWNTEGPLRGDCQGTFRYYDGVSASDWEKAFRRLAGSGRVLQMGYLNVSYPAFISGYAPNAIDGDGSAFNKAVEHSSLQLGLASYADEPLNFGLPTLNVYDFEVLVDGDTPTDGLLITREDTDDGTGSPGVIDKDGQPEHSKAAALHGDFGAFLGPHA